jgi:uncharacterized protein YqhQ
MKRISWEYIQHVNTSRNSFFHGAKHRLVTPIEKKEPITPDMLLK